MERIAHAGGLPIGLHLPARDEADALAETYAALCDGLLLQGGTDIDGRLSEAASTTEPDTDRDAFELALVFAFLQCDKTGLGICRGMQLVNVAAGGTLCGIDDAAVVQHSDPARYTDRTHAVVLAADGYLAHLHSLRRLPA
jgi:gamma-glutamyl-gamma-aminobutyrate hydrolase PuuD